jgi:predicted hydrocarbon binding protein
LYPGASVPSFEYQLSSDRKLTIIYSSAKKMCALAEGLIEGAAVYYGEPIIIQQSKCMLRGDSCCHIHVHST